VGLSLHPQAQPEASLGEGNTSNDSQVRRCRVHDVGHRPPPAACRRVPNMQTFLHTLAYKAPATVTSIEAGKDLPKGAQSVAGMLGAAGRRSSNRHGRGLPWNAWGQWTGDGGSETVFEMSEEVARLVWRWPGHATGGWSRRSLGALHHRRLRVVCPRASSPRIAMGARLGTCARRFVSPSLAQDPRPAKRSRLRHRSRIGYRTLICSAIQSTSCVRSSTAHPSGE